ncbi:MAG: deoxyribonuclease IV [Terriglobales bacterium]
MRVGAHVSSAGGVVQALARAHEAGCDTLQVFTSSPRQWRARPIPAVEAAAARQLRRKYRLRPLAVHASYLINVAGTQPHFRRQSVAALRGELERASAVGAEYLVLHPGSGAVADCVAGVVEAASGRSWGTLTLLIENTAGGGNHLAGTFPVWAQILDLLEEQLDGLKVGGCFDTCHTWVAGYDLVSPSGYAATMKELRSTVGLGRVKLVHANDAKAEQGSHHDRHEHIGKGRLGEAAFRQILQDPRWRGKAFIVETPLDGQARDMAALRRLAQ